MPAGSRKVSREGGGISADGGRHRGSGACRKVPGVWQEGLSLYGGKRGTEHREPLPAAGPRLLTDGTLVSKSVSERVSSLPVSHSLSAEPQLKSKPPDPTICSHHYASARNVPHCCYSQLPGTPQPGPASGRPQPPPAQDQPCQASAGTSQQVPVLSTASHSSTPTPAQRPGQLPAQGHDIKCTTRPVLSGR